MADWDAVEQLWSRAFEWLHVSTPRSIAKKKKKQQLQEKAAAEEGGSEGEVSAVEGGYESGHAGGHMVLCSEGATATPAEVSATLSSTHAHCGHDGKNIHARARTCVCVCVFCFCVC